MTVLARYTEDEVDDFLPYVEEGIKDSSGHVKALWFTTDVRVLYYRKDLISKPPKTWAELFELGKFSFQLIILISCLFFRLLKVSLAKVWIPP